MMVNLRQRNALQFHFFLFLISMSPSNLFPIKYLLIKFYISSLTFADNFLFHHAQKVSLYWPIPFFIHTAYEPKNPGVLYDFFQPVSISRYIFLGGKFAWLTLFGGWGTENLFQVSFFPMDRII